MSNYQSPILNNFCPRGKYEENEVIKAVASLLIALDFPESLELLHHSFMACTSQGTFSGSAVFGNNKYVMYVTQ